MVSSSSEIEPKEVKSVPDKVADKVDTVYEVVKKVEEPVVESNTVESDSLNEPNENDEKTPEPVPKEEALEPAPALATKSSYVPPHLRKSQGKRSEKSHQRQVQAGRKTEVDVQSQPSALQNQCNRSQRTVRKKNKPNRLIETI